MSTNGRFILGPARRTRESRDETDRSVADADVAPWMRWSSPCAGSWLLCGGPVAVPLRVLLPLDRRHRKLPTRRLSDARSSSGPRTRHRVRRTSRCAPVFSGIQTCCRGGQDVRPLTSKVRRPTRWPRVRALIVEGHAVGDLDPGWRRPVRCTERKARATSSQEEGRVFSACGCDAAGTAARISEGGPSQPQPTSRSCSGSRPGAISRRAFRRWTGKTPGSTCPSRPRIAAPHPR